MECDSVEVLKSLYFMKCQRLKLHKEARYDCKFNIIQKVVHVVYHQNSTHHGDLREDNGTNNSLVRNLVQKVDTNIGDTKQCKLRLQHT